MVMLDSLCHLNEDWVVTIELYKMRLPSAFCMWHWFILFIYNFPSKSLPIIWRLIWLCVISSLKKTELCQADLYWCWVDRQTVRSMFAVMRSQRKLSSVVWMQCFINHKPLLRIKCSWGPHCWLCKIPNIADTRRQWLVALQVFDPSPQNLSLCFISATKPDRWKLCAWTPLFCVHCL